MLVQIKTTVNEIIKLIVIAWVQGVITRRYIYIYNGSITEVQMNYYRSTPKEYRLYNGSKTTSETSSKIAGLPLPDLCWWVWAELERQLQHSWVEWQLFVAVRDPDEPTCASANLWVSGISLARCWVQDGAQVSSSEYLRVKLLVCVTPLEIGLGIRRLGLQPWAVLFVFAGVIG